MIPARHTWSGRAVCRFFSGYSLRRAFPGIQLIGPEQVPSGPVLLIGNHFSWWDGFIQYHLNEAVYRKRFHVMMLEEQLRRHPVLNKGGAFSIRKQSRDMIRSLQYTISLLEEPGNLVLLFPQGRIESLHQEQIVFEQGLRYLLPRISKETTVVFNVNLIDYHARKKPSLYVYHQPFEERGPDIEQMEACYNLFYQECKNQQRKIWQ
ncbi:MAG: lysophospholipid acyltransferase family protein [Tannerellaceae bacterium]|nr:lysophospholipid acyltransferase family protein [Tannerellaceae bacterium]